MTITIPTDRRLALEALGIRVSYPIRRDLLGRIAERFVAVDDVSISVPEATTLGVLGESGSGKSTLARAVGWLVPPDEGSVSIGGRQLRPGDKGDWVRAAVQYVFQDPYGALDPTKSVGAAVAEPLMVHRRGNPQARRARTIELLELVGLGPTLATRRPNELSGGQRQRVAIARALALDPRLVIADEPTSALDVSTRSEILNLFGDLQRELGTAFIFISHDVGTARHVAHRIAVMYRGRVVEEGDADRVVDSPRHPYTQALISAVLVPNPTLQRAKTRIPILRGRPEPEPGRGCPYRSRCHVASDVCAEVDVPLREVATGHLVACIKAQPDQADGADATPALFS